MARRQPTVVAMRRVRGFAAFACAVLAFAALPCVADAATAPHDSSATHAFLAADYQFARASAAKTNAIQRKIKAFEQKLRGECPHSGAGSPQNSQGHKLSYEVVVALWSITYGSLAQPIDALTHSIAKLQWSNHKITRIATQYANSLRRLARLPMPNLCADIASWKQSDYKTVPKTTLKLDAEGEAIELDPVPPSMLARFERSADKRLARGVSHLEVKLSERETLLGGNDWFDTLEVLSLNE